MVQSWFELTLTGLFPVFCSLCNKSISLRHDAGPEPQFPCRAPALGDQWGAEQPVYRNPLTSYEATKNLPSLFYAWALTGQLKAAVLTTTAICSRGLADVITALCVWARSYLWWWHSSTLLLSCDHPHCCPLKLNVRLTFQHLLRWKNDLQSHFCQPGYIKATSFLSDITANV